MTEHAADEHALAKQAGTGWVVVWEAPRDDSGAVTRGWLGPWFALQDATAAATGLQSGARGVFVSVAHLSYTLVCGEQVKP